MIVDMPIYPSHHEHEFFPEPARFDPDRFLKDNAKGIIPHTYRPFGGITVLKGFWQFRGQANIFISSYCHINW